MCHLMCDYCNIMKLSSWVVSDSAIDCSVVDMMIKADIICSSSNNR